MYPILDIKAPQDKRKEFNNKILHIVDNDIEHPQITPDVIFNMYSPLGSFHGLEFNNYNSFYEFQQAKKDVHFGQYFTPLHVSKALSLMLRVPKEYKIADLTAGTGSLINFLHVPDENIYCNEWELKAYKILKYLFPNINHSNKDIREYKSDVLFDCIVGNPPFGLVWNHNKNQYNSEVFYLLKSFELLKPSGICAVIVPESFLIDDFKDKGNINLINKHFNFVAQFVLPTNIFESVGAKITTKIMIFQKKSEHIPDLPYINGQHNRIDIQSLDNRTVTELHKLYIKPLYEQKEKVKSKLILEAIQQGNEKNNDFEYKVKKMLFDIKRGKNTQKHYNRCEAYLLKFKTQEKLPDESYEEWTKRRITENKVLSYLKRVLRDQHKQELNITKLVSNRYGLKIKAYSRKEQLKLNKLNITKEMSFNDMLINGVYPFQDETYKNLYNRKRSELLAQSTPIKELSYNSKINLFLDNFTLYNKDKNIQIKLFDYQKEALSKLLQKRYSMLNLTMGLGKTESIIAYINYLQQHKPLKNYFIISSSLSINMTWVNRLNSYNIPFKIVSKLSDIAQLQTGDIVLITFNMITKYQKQLKKYIKMQYQKVSLVVDESHKLSNNTSKRTKAVLNVFRKVKNKLLATGTATRNNLNELYPQLELLFNNSINMLCICEEVQKEDTKTGELKAYNNDYYMKPFPANKISVFKSCFSPSKQSVFGIEKDNQNIYNSQHLKTLIESFIYTKKFHEVASDKYEIETHRIYQNENEKEVYKKIMTEFYEMIPKYFSSTGNYRKDAMLRILRQLQLMIKAVSIPHKLKEYNGHKEPNKYKYIENLIKSHNEKIIIGTVFVDSASYYYNKLLHRFPDRRIYFVDGSISFKQRQGIIEEFEKSNNSIIVTTQQSLSESVNIPSCNMVICEALQWNVSNLEQFYFRTIRIDSETKTNVHLITYNNTVEQNMLALLMSKERINEWIKTLEYREQSDIFDEFGITTDIFNSIITKEKDDEGHVTLSWGKQQIV